MSGEDVLAEAFSDFLNALEAGITAAKQRLKERAGLWDPSKIKWETVQGPSGTFEKSEDRDNPEFKAMLKDLAAHKGKLTREGYFYWTYKNGSTVGRKKRG